MPQQQSFEVGKPPQQRLEVWMPQKTVPWTWYKVLLFELILLATVTLNSMLIKCNGMQSMIGSSFLLKSRRQCVWIFRTEIVQFVVKHVCRGDTQRSCNNRKKTGYMRASLYCLFRDVALTRQLSSTWTPVVTCFYNKCVQINYC
jgi:hypothetical protein